MTFSIHYWKCVGDDFCVIGRALLTSSILFRKCVYSGNMGVYKGWQDSRGPYCAIKESSSFIQKVVPF